MAYIPCVKFFFSDQKSCLEFFSGKSIFIQCPPSIAYPSRPPNGMMRRIPMAKKKVARPVLSDLIEQIMDQHDIPTRKDFSALMDRMAQLENLLKQIHLTSGMGMGNGAGGRKAGGRKGKRAGLSAADVVLSVMREHGGEISFKEIREKTGYDDKKLRNIVFRMYKTGKIMRENRGAYQIVSEKKAEETPDMA
jgi:hypothetical protein